MGFLWSQQLIELRVEGVQMVQGIDVIPGCLIAQQAQLDDLVVGVMARFLA